MKATRRHELKENDLAHAIEVAKGYLVEHGTGVGLLLLLTIGAVAVVSITVRTRAGNVERVWAQRTALTFDDPASGKESIEKLRALTSEATDQNFILTSLIDQGTQALRLAQQVALPPDPELNDRARDAFEALAERFPTNALALGVAHSGLATVEENDFAIDTDLTHKERARAHLQAILDDSSLNLLPFNRLAADRLAKLDGVFTFIRFAPAEPAAPTPEAAAPTPITVTPTRIPADQVPEHLKRIAGPPGAGVFELGNDGTTDEAAGENADDQSVGKEDQEKAPVSNGDPQAEPGGATGRSSDTP
ncbi:MAG: hypothetical protein ACE5HE_01040 [Phycisphaerae bacterium]